MTASGTAPSPSSPSSWIRIRSRGLCRGGRHVPVARAGAACRRARRPLWNGAGSWQWSTWRRGRRAGTTGGARGDRRIDLALLLVLVFANGGARAIYYSASQATVPELIRPASLARANGILSGTEAATEHLGGPVLGTLAFAAAKALPFSADAVAVGVLGPVAAWAFAPSARRGAQAHGARYWTVPGASLRDRPLRLLVTLLAALAGLQGLVRRRARHSRDEPTGECTGASTACSSRPAPSGNVPGALLARSHRRAGSGAFRR